MGNTRLEVGIIGLGTHGTNHARVLTEMGHEVSGADADPKLRRQFRRTFDATTYDTPTDLFRADVDAVVITTPNKFHEPAAVEALEAGLDVLLEKPLSHTLESAGRIADVSRETGNVCMVGYHHRYRNVCQLLKEYIDDGYLGDITHVDATFVRRRGIPGRGTWYTSDGIAGGGAMMDIGAHLMDLLLYFCGWPDVEAVMSTARSDFGGRDDYAYIHMWGEDDRAKMYDVEDSVTAFCEFENGTTANVEVAWAANTRATHSYLIRGTESGAFVDVTNSLDEVEPERDDRDELELFEARKAGVDHYVDSEIVTPSNDPYEDEFRAFVEAVDSGERPAMCGVEEALKVQRAIQRIYDASDAD